MIERAIINHSQVNAGQKLYAVWHIPISIACLTGNAELPLEKNIFQMLFLGRRNGRHFCVAEDI